MRLTRFTCYVGAIIFCQHNIESSVPDLWFCCRTDFLECGPLCCIEQPGAWIVGQVGRLQNPCHCRACRIDRRVRRGAEDVALADWAHHSNRVHDCFRGDKDIGCGRPTSTPFRRSNVEPRSPTAARPRILKASRMFISTIP